MAIHDRSPRETLHLHPSLALPSWALFDPAWYRARHPGAPDLPDGELLDWYLTEGQRRGHSPCVWFDETWQRRAWPGIAALIEAGAAGSAFDAWCRGANALRAPHWLFDPARYQASLPALTPEALADMGLFNLYDHYLRTGAAEGRIGHVLFDPAVYGSASDPETDSPYARYLRALDRGEAERRTSWLFDPDWYRARYPEPAREVAEGRWRSLLEHYLCNDTPGAFDPSPYFSEEHYFREYPGLKDAIGPQGFRDGFAHFVTYGMAEGRSPHPDLDLAWYAGQPAVRADPDAGRPGNASTNAFMDAFTHWIRHGQAAGLPGRPSAPSPVPAPDSLTQAQAVAAHRMRAETLWPLYHRRKPDFTCVGEPSLSVIMVIGDALPANMVSLGALRAGYAGDIDLILIDCTAGGPGADIESQVAGAMVLRFGASLTDAAAREAGLVCARAKTILLLGEGLELAHGAIDAAWERLEADPAAGAVGGRLIEPHGMVREAGWIAWADGRIQAYGEGLPANAPEVTYAREVDFCSTLFLMARAAALTGLPEPNPGLAASTHDAADLGARLREAGWRVVYEPNAVAFQTQARAGGETLPDGREAYVAAHSGYLATRPAFSPDPAALIQARSPAPGAPRILFVEDTVPLRFLGSGFVRSNDIIRAMAASGAFVTIAPMHPPPFNLAAIRAGLPDTVEVMRDLSAKTLPAFLAARRGCHDLIWVARTHNLDLIQAALADQAEPRPPVILDTEALASLRSASWSALTGEIFDLDTALARELRNLALTAHVLAVTEAEAAILRGHHPGPVSVLGHALAPRPMPRGFEDRTGILFLGALHDEAHPNHDSLVWFVEQVLPEIEKTLRWETRLTVAGYVAPGVSLERFRNHPRVTLRGPVTDTRTLYDTHRVFVAPTRHAAGLPYKVHEAAANGLPVVATTLLARQLGWPDDEVVLTAAADDPLAFAKHVIALHRDPGLWSRLREAALERVARDLNPDDFARSVQEVLRSTPDGTRPSRNSPG